MRGLGLGLDNKKQHTKKVMYALFHICLSLVGWAGRRKLIPCMCVPHRFIARKSSVSILHIDKPEAKAQSKAPKSPKKGKRNLASGLVTKILWATHHPTHNF